MLAEGEDVKFAAKTKSIQDHKVNSLPAVFFYAAMRKKLLYYLSFKDTMMLGVLNF